jgi:hypothetical protein
MPAGSTYEPIATTTLGSNQTSYTFNSISGTYTDLVLVSNVKSTQAGTGANGMRVTINGDTGSNYSDTGLSSDGTTASSGRSTSQAYFIAGNLPQASNTAWAVNITHFMNYSNTTTFKTMITRGNIANVVTEALVSLWRSTSAITSIKIERDGTNQLASGSMFTLYGIKAA